MRRSLIAVGMVPVLVALNSGSVAEAAAPTGQNGVDTRVNVGSPRGHFPRNKQNEPAVSVAIDPTHPNVVVSGSNDEIDNAPCNGSDCSFTPGVTDNGVYFSFNGGKSYSEPTYTGWSARSGTPKVGPIGTVPKFFESRLVGDGDPALAFGPRPGPHGFQWSGGSRLYYASLTSNFPNSTTIPAGAEGIAVSRTDHVGDAATGHKNAWMAPVVASNGLTSNTFSDKEAVWADNASSSQFFGNAYLCWASFDVTSTGQPPLVFARSIDGGSTWSNPVTILQASTGTAGPSGCTIRTDSHGTVYVMWLSDNFPGTSAQMLARSFNGGLTFEQPREVASVADVGRLDPVHVANGDPRLTFDGIAGARTGSDPSIDIANGAPGGADATNQIVLTWSDARRGLNHEEALVRSSEDRGLHWSQPVAAQQGGDRPDFPAIAISPNGTDVYLTYDAFLAPWRESTFTPRPMQGVVRHASVRGEELISDFATLHRGDVGDARGSSENNLCCEFLGDYNYVSASRTAGVAVWNDVRAAQVCDVMNAYRESFLAATRLPKPSPATQCPPRFGNSDIFGGAYTP